MRLLLDTHAFLWFILDEPPLSPTARSLIADPNNEINVSPATYWEIAIKIRLDKYKLPEPFQEFMERQIAVNRFNILHIEPRHVAPITTLPFHHKDPFDRLVPIIVDGATVVHDSWRIATYLEDRFPDRPTFFGDDAARAGARFLNLWSDTLLVTLRRLMSADFVWCLAPEDWAYFRESREKELG